MARRVTEAQAREPEGRGAVQEAEGQEAGAGAAAPSVGGLLDGLKGQFQSLLGDFEWPSALDLIKLVLGGGGMEVIGKRLANAFQARAQRALGQVELGAGVRALIEGIDAVMESGQVIVPDGGVESRVAMGQALAATQATQLAQLGQELLHYCDLQAAVVRRKAQLPSAAQWDSDPQLTAARHARTEATHALQSLARQVGRLRQPEAPQLVTPSSLAGRLPAGSGGTSGGKGYVGREAVERTARAGADLTAEEGTRYGQLPGSGQPAQWAAGHVPTNVQAGQVINAAVSGAEAAPRGEPRDLDGLTKAELMRLAQRELGMGPQEADDATKRDLVQALQARQATGAAPSVGRQHVASGEAPRVIRPDIPQGNAIGAEHGGTDGRPGSLPGTGPITGQAGTVVYGDAKPSP